MGIKNLSVEAELLQSIRPLAALTLPQPLIVSLFSSSFIFEPKVSIPFSVAIISSDIITFSIVDMPPERPDDIMALWHMLFDGGASILPFKFEQLTLMLSNVPTLLFPTIKIKTLSNKYVSAFEYLGFDETANEMIDCNMVFLYDIGFI